MGLKKGQSNNLKGRPKGSMNLVNKDLRKMITEIVAGKLENINMLAEKLEPRDQIKFLIELLSYALPKFESTKFNDPNSNNSAESLIDEINHYLSIKKNEVNNKGISE